MTMTQTANDLIEKLKTRPTATVEEAAAALGISRGLAYDMARTGDLPTVRCGRRWVVKTRALFQMLAIES
jgi:excisionase family DNA binding protein